jgi:hypothetical protein
MTATSLPPVLDGAEVLDPVPLEVARPMVLLRLGYRRPSQVPDRTARMIAEVEERGRALLAPRAVLAEAAVAAGGGTVALGGDRLRSTSRSLGERLEGCRIAVLFAATIGEALEAWGRELLDAGQMARSLLVDAYASSAAILLGTEIETIVTRRFAARGLAAGKRYAPGYGDWDLEDQTPLCALVGAGRIGIRVTAEHLMVPAKSISGVIGGRPAAG